MTLETENRLSITTEVAATQSGRVVVFDMDGTLYQLDGTDNGFPGSSLERTVIENAKMFVTSRENCSGPDATLMVNRGLADFIGLSNFLSQRYGITREEYFNEVWDINPEGIVRNFEDAVEAVKQLAKDNMLILLTSAPKTWQKRVFEFLGLEGCFGKIYTGESFGLKDEIFKKLSEDYDSGSILSVGDQLATDIEPASRLGMDAFLVSGPGDLKTLAEKTRRRK